MYLNDFISIRACASEKSKIGVVISFIFDLKLNDRDSITEWRKKLGWLSMRKTRIDSPWCNLHFQNDK